LGVRPAVGSQNLAFGWLLRPELLIHILILILFLFIESLSFLGKVGSVFPLKTDLSLLFIEQLDVRRAVGSQSLTFSWLLRPELLITILIFIYIDIILIYRKPLFSLAIEKAKRKWHRHKRECS